MTNARGIVNGGVTAVRDGTWDAVIAILLAIAGGIARLLNGKDRTRLKWSVIFYEIFVAGFAGIMTLFLARAAGLSGDWLGLVCGIAGWTSPRILHAITKLAERLLGLDENELKKRK